MICLFNQQAAALGTKIIDEDGLLNLIRTMPGKKSKYEIAVEAEVCMKLYLFKLVYSNFPVSQRYFLDGYRPLG